MPRGGMAMSELGPGAQQSQSVMPGMGYPGMVGQQGSQMDPGARGRQFGPPPGLWDSQLADPRWAGGGQPRFNGGKGARPRPVSVEQLAAMGLLMGDQLPYMCMNL